MSKKEVKKVSKAPFNELPLGKENYLMMLAGLVVIIIGFVLMSGGDTDIYNFMKMKIAPNVLLLGFFFEIYAIMKKPKAKTDNTEA